MNRNKARGSEAELRARDILEADGYVVTKAGGSLGAADLVAMRADGCKIIQVKSSKASFGPAAVRFVSEELARVEVPECCGSRELWHLRRRGPGKKGQWTRWICHEDGTAT